jgi:periplasmic protein TonB
MPRRLLPRLNSGESLTNLLQGIIKSVLPFISLMYLSRDGFSFKCSPCPVGALERGKHKKAARPCPSGSGAGSRCRWAGKGHQVAFGSRVDQEVGLAAQCRMQQIVHNSIVAGPPSSRMSLRRAFLCSASFHAFLFLSAGVVSVSAPASVRPDNIIVVDFSVSSNEKPFPPALRVTSAAQWSPPKAARQRPGERHQPVAWRTEADFPPRAAATAQHDSTTDIVLEAKEGLAVPGNGPDNVVSPLVGQTPPGGSGTTGDGHGAQASASETRGSGSDSNTGKPVQAALAVAYGREHFAFIHSAIVQRLSYPPVARRRGWFGTVRISFVVSADGTAHNIRVIESSGFELLDKSSLEAVRQAAPFPKPPAAAEILMPIAYRMNDG